jgi:hypothetical protein
VVQLVLWLRSNIGSIKAAKCENIEQDADPGLQMEGILCYARDASVEQFNVQ